LNPIPVLRPLSDQDTHIAMQLSGILRLLIRYSHHAPDSSLAANVSDQLLDQLLRVHPVCFGSPMSAVDFNRCRIDRNIFNAAADQGAV
jgi:hypothetical protein